MADFAKIKTSDTKGRKSDTQIQSFYPTDGSDQSLNQLPTYKLMTGSTRGDQQIKGRILVLDETNVVRLVMGYDPGGF